jgi:formylglycine-generating enzyme required for sulfatase activity
MGGLVCTNLQPGSVATVEWAPSVTGPWTNSWQGLAAVTADSNGSIRVSVPMFYRVRGTYSAPSGMALIPAGSFTMGNCMDPSEGDSAELPLHTVYMSAFYMDQNLVTSNLWWTVKAWNGGNGYAYEGAASAIASDHPVQYVSWYDVVKWCNARSQKEGLTPCYYTDAGLTVIYKSGRVEPYVNWNARGYRLGTEAEWEKAARGGASGHRFPWSDSDSIQHSRANYFAYRLSGTNVYTYDTSPTANWHPTFNGGTSPVGYFAANGYGLYDMAGNEFEWCWDWYQTDWYNQAGATQSDTRGPTGPSTYRVMRGGAFNMYAVSLRCATRGNLYPAGGSPTVGFRCVRGL